MRKYLNDFQNKTTKKMREKINLDVSKVYQQVSIMYIGTEFRSG